MKQLKLKVNGMDYPCRITMGALLLYKRNMGKEVVLNEHSDMEDILMFMWCCIVSACRADGVEFNMDFETFCCYLEPQDVAAWNEAIKAAANKDQKKTEP